MVVDTFMFAGETDMLYFRLAHLDGKVARHVITEADQTHRGVPRELWIPRHLDCCLLAYRDRISWVPVSFPGSLTAPWDREHYQRDRALDTMPRWQPDDIILISDIDEIPSGTALAASPAAGPAALRQRIFHSAVDWEYPEPQLTSVMTPAGTISQTARLSRIRDARYGLPVIEDGGWHFSWLGTAAERRRKLEERTCHTEMSEREAQAISTGATWTSGEHAAADAYVKAVDVDGTWPDYIRERRCPPYWFRPRSGE